MLGPEKSGSELKLKLVWAPLRQSWHLETCLSKPLPEVPVCLHPVCSAIAFPSSSCMAYFVLMTYANLS